MFFSCAPIKWFCCIGKVQWWFTASRVHLLLQGSSWVHVHSVMPSRNSLRCVLEAARGSGEIWSAEVARATETAEAATAATMEHMLASVAASATKDAAAIAAAAMAAEAAAMTEMEETARQTVRPPAPAPPRRGDRIRHPPDWSISQAILVRHRLF